MEKRLTMERVRNTGMNILFVAGWILMYCIMSTDEFYVTELGQFRPINWKLIFIAFLMIAPKTIEFLAGEHFKREERR